MNTTNYGYEPSKGADLKTPILFGAVIALIASNIFFYLQLEQVKTAVDLMKTNVRNEVATLRESSTLSSESARRNIVDLEKQLQDARQMATSAAGQAAIDARKHAEQLAKRLEQAQLVAKEELKSEISSVQETANAATTKIGEVSTEVGTVKSEVASTKSELEKTIGNLTRVTGDLGVQSGLIARNGDELAALRALGERNYFEFKLSRTKQPQKVGDIALILRKSDMKRNRYTMEVYADDKKVEKKDKNLNEPVQFYVSKARQPYEIVVNQISKDTIAGYLATPKVTQARN